MQLVLLFCIVASGTVTNFFPTVVNTLQEGALSEASRDSSVISLLLTAPPYVLAVIVTYLNAMHADKTGERYWHITIPMWVAVVAYIIAATTTHIVPRYLSMMLMVSLPLGLISPSSLFPFPLSPSPHPRTTTRKLTTPPRQVPSVYSGFVVALAWISNTMPRPPAKRAAALAFINAVSNCSSIYASYLYPKSADPHYTVAMIVNCVMAFIAVCAATVMRAVLVRLNRKLDAGVWVEGAINALPGEGANRFRFKV
jgi:hypothetical protein